MSGMEGRLGGRLLGAMVMLGCLGGLGYPTMGGQPRRRA
jgi:hypothetical protein